MPTDQGGPRDEASDLNSFCRCLVRVSTYPLARRHLSCALWRYVQNLSCTWSSVITTSSGDVAGITAPEMLDKTW